MQGSLPEGVCIITQKKKKSLDQFLDKVESAMAFMPLMQIGTPYSTCP